MLYLLSIHAVLVYCLQRTRYKNLDQGRSQEFILTEARGFMASAGARAYNGGLGAEPPAGSRGRAPGQGVRGRSPPEAERL